VGIFLCPAAGLKSCGNTAFDRTFQPGRGIEVNTLGKIAVSSFAKQVLTATSQAEVTTLRELANPNSCDSGTIDCTLRSKIDKAIVADKSSRTGRASCVATIYC